MALHHCTPACSGLFSKDGGEARAEWLKLLLKTPKLNDLTKIVIVILMMMIMMMMMMMMMVMIKIVKKNKKINSKKSKWINRKLIDLLIDKFIDQLFSWKRWIEMVKGILPDFK